MEALVSSTKLVDEEKALKSLLDSFGSVFSLEDIASAFCKAGQDANLARELLSGTRTLSSDNAFVSNGYVKSQMSSGFRDASESSESWYANGNGDRQAFKLRRNPASMGIVSNVIGKNYAWRVRKDTTSNETEPLKVEDNKQSEFVDSSGESLRGRVDDASVNRDFENFLFEMLGHGFQLERSAIREVLGHCGYDMKKSLETLLDLTAVSLDRRNDFQEGSNLNSNSKTLMSQNQVRKQNFAESGSGIRTDRILSWQPEMRYEQQKEVLTSLFHVPERPDLSVRTPVLESAGRSRPCRTVVTEPLEDIDHEALKAKTTTHHLVINMKDDTEEDDYHILRKAVREYRDTMKEYYKAAADAFTAGDRARANLLVEKGQFFYNRAREADEESAQKIFETSGGDGGMQDEMCLDLQHHDVKEAIRILKSHLRSLCGIPSIRNLKIIVGIGEQDVKKRKRLVLKLLERESISWTEDENMGTVLVRLDKINPTQLSFVRKSTKDL